jgi:hypothetical protein
MGEGRGHSSAAGSPVFAQKLRRGKAGSHRGKAKGKRLVSDPRLRIDGFIFVCSLTTREVFSAGRKSCLGREYWVEWGFWGRKSEVQVEYHPDRYLIGRVAAPLANGVPVPIAAPLANGVPVPIAGPASNGGGRHFVKTANIKNQTPACQSTAFALAGWPVPQHIHRAF